MRSGKKIVPVFVGTVILLFSGIIYGWSILSAPIMAEFSDLSGGSLSLTFTLSMIFFCLGGLTAGIMAKRTTTRFRLILAGVMFFAGFQLAAQAKGLALLYLGYGLCCGMGSGFSYNAVMTAIPRQYAARQGVVSGILLMGFGASSLVIGSAFTALLPHHIGGWRGGFQIIGWLTLAVMFFGAFTLKTTQDTNEDLAEGEQTPEQKELIGIPPGQMIKKLNFWLFFLWIIVISAVGLSVISQAGMIAITACPALHAETVTLLAGIVSVCNGLGRIVFGTAYDRLRWRKTMLMINLASIAGSLILMAAMGAHSVSLIVAGLIVTGLAYGGSPTMCAAYTRDFYGAKFYAVNFQIVLLNLLPASFGGTLTGILYDISGSYISTLIVLSLCGCAALLIGKYIRK